jgi:hypothetical protein
MHGRWESRMREIELEKPRLHGNRQRALHRMLLLALLIVAVITLGLAGFISQASGPEGGVEDPIGDAEPYGAGLSAPDLQSGSVVLDAGALLLQVRLPLAPSTPPLGLSHRLLNLVE